MKISDVMKWTLLLIVFGLYLASALHAQQPFKIRPLRTGEKVPNLVFSHMANYHSRQARLSDFKGKLVILDFWNKHCPSCIAGVPKLEKIQSEYGSQVQILLVNCINSLNDMKGFPQNSPFPYLKRTDLPYVLGVPEFKKLFYHELEPFDVWIDANGIMRASTTGYNVTSKHVKEFLEGKQPAMRDLTGGSAIDGTSGQSILREQNAWVLNKLQYHSALLPELFIGSINGPISDSVTGKTIGAIVTDADMSFLFMFANDFHGGRDRILYEVKDSERFFAPKDANQEDEWRMKWNFGYEIVLPVEACPNDDGKSWKKVLSYMRQDLERSFGITGSVETRMVKCMALVKIGDTTILKTKGGEAHYEPLFQNGYKAFNSSLDEFCESLKAANQYRGALPIVNSTNYTKGVDIEIAAPLSNIPAVRQELRKYGLDLIETERELQMLILKDAE